MEDDLKQNYGRIPKKKDGDNLKKKMEDNLKHNLKNQP